MTEPTLFSPDGEPTPESVDIAASGVTDRRPSPTHRNDPETSLIAARVNEVRAGTQRARTLLLLVGLGTDGATDFVLADKLGHPRPHVIGTRRGELVALGLVEDSGRRASSDLGNPAVVWQVTDLGLAVALRLEDR